MKVISNLVFDHEVVTLDGKHFVDCTLDACKLVYRGGAVTFERTRLARCSYIFGGQARRTVELLKLAGILGEPFSARVETEERVN